MARRRRKRKFRRVRFRLPELTVKQILAWADAYFAAGRRWPKKEAGRIPGSIGETWMRVHSALQKGYRGLPGGSSLARLLAEQRGVRNHMALPQLSRAQILTWADAHYRRTGSWPRSDSGRVTDARDENWSALSDALERGRRGLAGGSSLAALLAEERGVRNRKNLPPFRIRAILAWADAHQRRTGRWPTHLSGAIVEAPGETWGAIDSALWKGLRGLPGRDTLARLLERRRGVRNRRRLPHLTIARILAWADAHQARTGRRPTYKSGPIPGSNGETWAAVQAALRVGCRGLPGGDTLAAVFARYRGHRNRAALPPLSVAAILDWARAHRRRTGRWPSAHAGPVAGTNGEIWLNIDQALRKGLRGFRGGSSLSKLLHRATRSSR
jgi:hypothetical protein